jgi:putative ABC transport system permease protein
MSSIPLAWLQLTHEKLRMLVALAGVGFAVVLIFMQLGFREALFDSSVRYHKAFRFDLALISPRTQFIVQPDAFSRRRLYQALSLPGVAGVKAVYLRQARWRDPTRPDQTRMIFLVGFDPSERVFQDDGIVASPELLQMPDVFLFDARSRREFGPVPDLVRQHGRVEAEVNNRRIQIAGLFELGTSFGIDGSLITSDLNFLRLFPDSERGLINLGLVDLKPGTDPVAARKALADYLPDDVEVLTRAEYIQRELDYWNNNTPIGYVFAFGVIVGLCVGGIIVYQILFADVSDHIQEYATLKAMGYTNRYLFGVVFQEAALLAALGYLPGLMVCLGLYRLAGDATALPMEMTWLRGGLVLLLTVLMCCLAGGVALRKVRSADPADVF